MIRFTLLSLALLLGSAPAALSYPAYFVDAPHLSGLTNPIGLAWTPDGRLFIAERGGRIRIWDGAMLQTALTLSVRLVEEQGLLGLAIDPGFPTQPYVYLLYSPIGTSTQRISRFAVSGSTITPASEVVLHSTLPTGFGYHVAGCLRATASGHLYASNGENGWNTGYQHAQDLTRLEGKLIRIGLDGSIPADNPFVGVAGAKPEIFHRGLRNPFRFAIQPGTSRTFISEVGSTVWEEINTGPPGSNFGWPSHEGAVMPPPAGVTNPLYAYSNSAGGAAIVGCAFYTGGPFPPEYDGNFFFLDHVRGHLGRMVLDGSNNVVSVDRLWGNTVSAGWANGPVDLAQGPDGALYYTTYSGLVRRVSYTGTVAVASPEDSPRLALAIAPNPFVSATRIRFAVRQPGRAQLTLHDVGGRRVRTLVDAHREAGAHDVEWDGRDDGGRRLAAGIFLVRLESGDEVISHRVALTR